MIRVTLYEDKGIIYRIKFSGHAGYAEHGEDIVCSAVSLLTLNTFNSIEDYTDEPMKHLKCSEKKGLIDVEFPRRKSGDVQPEAELLIRTLIHGLIDTKRMYGEKYIKIINKTRR